MKLGISLLVALSLPAPVLAQARAPACQPLTTLVVAQRSYAQVNLPVFEQRVYVYAPDIKSGWGGKFEPFTLWVVEGVYGKPFGQASGALDERAFEQIRTSRNVQATAVTIDQASLPKRSTVAVGKQQLALEIARVNTSLGGTDTVSLNICR